ncbi:unnamed protein product [Dicrocoelium dendriticum]|nr:unnamed protein product [Dicrocoelium dendriticum]
MCSDLDGDSLTEWHNISLLQPLHLVYERQTIERLTIGGDALAACDKLVRIFLEEAFLRSIAVARADNRDSVTVEDFENILIQLMLDFSA